MTSLDSSNLGDYGNIFVEEHEIAAVDGNQDLSKEWKIMRSYETNEVIYHSQYRSEVVEHSKRSSDVARSKRANNTAQIGYTSE